MKRLKKIRRGLKALSKKLTPKPGTGRRKIQFESMEKRLLLSADLGISPQEHIQAPPVLPDLTSPVAQFGTTLGGPETSAADVPATGAPVVSPAEGTAVSGSVGDAGDKGVKQPGETDPRAVKDASVPEEQDGASDLQEAAISAATGQQGQNPLLPVTSQDDTQALTPAAGTMVAAASTDELQAQTPPADRYHSPFNPRSRLSPDRLPCFRSMHGWSLFSSILLFPNTSPLSKGSRRRVRTREDEPAPAAQSDEVPDAPVQTTSSLTHSITGQDAPFADTELQNTRDEQKAEEPEADTRYEVIVLDSGRDGVEQISETLEQYQGISAVHIVSHGAVGTLRLGNNLIRTEDLEQNAAKLKTWQGALRPGGDILLYGCEIAGNEAGIAVREAARRAHGSRCGRVQRRHGQCAAGRGLGPGIHNGAH